MLKSTQRISIYRPAKLARNWSTWSSLSTILDGLLLTVEWSGARSCLFVMTSPFSDSIVFSVHTRKQRFQKASFSNGSDFGDRFRLCSVDDSYIRSKTAPFSFENGLVWTGPKWLLIREFKKLLRRRQRQRRLKNEFIFHLRISGYSSVIYFIYHCQNYHETDPGTAINLK